MFRVKICGITSARDAEAAVRFGADAVGVNFFAGSPRSVSREEAARIVAAVRGSALVVAVFVDESPAAIVALCGSLGIDAVQLAGSETVEQAAALPLRRIRSVRPASGGFAPGPGYPCEAFLLDAHVPGKFGGTGAAVDWERAAAWVAGLRAARRMEGLPPVPCILAGGLRPENVERAIRVVRPDGVDVASGVEAGPRAKDPAKMEAFIRNALEGLSGAAA